MFGSLKSLFGEKKETVAALKDLSALGVDMHSHLIPGIDDGSKSMDDTLYMLRVLEELGYRKVITSPHVVSDGYNNSTVTILSGRDKIRQAIKENNIALEFDAVAEYYVDETLLPKIEQKDILTFGKGYVLVELSYLNKPNNAGEIFYKLQVAGYKIVLAHPERYPYYHESSFAQYESLKDRNLLFQINIMSLIGKYGKDAQYTAERMIDKGMVDMIGLDLHTVKQLESIKECLKTKYLSRALASSKLLNNTL
ncbi:MAG: histidinol phosphatase [Chitinophagales bacterium]|nr:histidinol phosphatase [Chitinophagales bacterium]